MKLLSSIIPALIAGFAALPMSAELRFDIQADCPGSDIAPTMYGLFFEDINFAADGGLYAEMVKNRSFEFPDRLMGWRTSGDVSVLEGGPFPRNPHYVRLQSPGHGHKRTCIDNEGFFGVAFAADSVYRFSVWGKPAGASPSRIRVELIDPAADGETQVCASAVLGIDSPDWTRYTATLRPSVTVARGRLRIFLDSSEPVDLEHVSLFPEGTWRGHVNGLRNDIASLLAAMHPGVFRFPGGCIVEGTDLDSRYQWKNSVGPVENRPLNENRWQYTFPSRFYPDYYQSYGLGFYEYFLLAEEMGAAPLPVLSVGLACQFQNNDESAHVPADSLDSYIQDAIDLVEFANGDTTTVWGGLRGRMGHPEPFNLRYIAIGNEQWGPEYPVRLAKFVDALRSSCPDIQIVGSSGPGSEGEQFDYLWPEMRRLGVDLVDEHFYRPESWFLSQGTRYDSYPRTGPKVFAGEYACHGKGFKRNHFHASLLEAAFMTGLERNADIVRMATYAPLLAHVEGWQWRPDMIWFDNLRSVPTASYYVQQLYAVNKGTRVIPLTHAGKPVAGLDTQQGLFASAVIDDRTGHFIVKIVNTSDVPQDIILDFHGLPGSPSKSGGFTCGKAITLSADSPEVDNTLDHPDLVVPVEKPMEISGASVPVTIGPNTFAVYIFN